MSRFNVIAVLAKILAFATAVWVLPASAFVYQGFYTTDCTTSLNCVGSAAVVGNSALRLTAAQGGEAGAAYSKSPIMLGANATFSTQFLFRFTGAGGVDPADGIVFIVSDNATGLGSVGSGIGYAGASAHSVGIEFDTFNNSGSYNNGAGTNDNSSNHVAIDLGGVLTNAQSTNPYGVADCTSAGGYGNTTNTNTYLSKGCMSNGDDWLVSIGYDGPSNKLSVSVQNYSAGSAVDDIITDYAFPSDLATILGSPTAYVGFTSGTGAGFENHDIEAWSFTSDLKLAPPAPPAPPSTDLPEPLPLALFAIGAAGMALARRRR